MAWVMMAPSADIRVASQGGTRPPWRGKSALPVRLAIGLYESLLGTNSIRSGASGPSGLSIGHGPKRDGITRCLDGGNAVFPDLPGLARHQIERARPGIERIALPS